MDDLQSAKPLGDYVGLQRGNTYKGALLGQDGPVLLGLASIARNGGFRSDNLKTYGGPSDERMLLEPGEIYVSLKDVTQSADLLGAVARVPDTISQGRLTQDTVKLNFKDEKSPKTYIYWVLRTPQYRAYCKAHATGTTNLGLPRDDFLAFPIPPLTPVRRTLLELLQSLDEKIELNRQMNETLEAMARAIFKDWFVDFGPTRAKAEGRAPYLAPKLWDLFPNALDYEGKPVGWYRSNLGDQISVLETGKRPRGGVAGILGGVPSVGAESIVKVGEFDFSKTKYVPTAFFSMMRKGHVTDGDVLIYKDGGKPGELRPAVTYVSNGFPFAEFCINEHVFRIRTETFSQPLLYCMLSTDDAFWQMKERATGVAQPGLNQRAVKSIDLTMSDDTRLLRAAEAMIDPFIDGCNCNALNSRVLAQTRDTLLPKLMSGEIRIRDAKKAVEAVA